MLQVQNVTYANLFWPSILFDNEQTLFNKEWANTVVGSTVYGSKYKQKKDSASDKQVIVANNEVTKH